MKTLCILIYLLKLFAAKFIFQTLIKANHENRFLIFLHYNQNNCIPITVYVTFSGLKSKRKII